MGLYVTTAVPMLPSVNHQGLPIRTNHATVLEPSLKLRSLGHWLTGALAVQLIAGTVYEIGSDGLEEEAQSLFTGLVAIIASRLFVLIEKGHLPGTRHLG